MRRAVQGSVMTLSAAVVLALGSWQLYGVPQAKESGGPLKPFMQRKLDHSKSVLEGLAIEDFAMIAKNAQALSLLSQESNWNVLNTEEYLQQSRDFRRAVNVITEAAHAKNIDRATLGYIDLTVRCVGCHKYLRDQGNPRIVPELNPAPKKKP